MNTPQLFCRSSMRYSLLRLPAYWCVLGLVLAVGCAPKPPDAPPQTPTVTVSKPIEDEVTDYAEFTGRTDAVVNTDIRPRVTGYLVGMPFKEGALVKKDDVLFQIDDRPYKASLDQAKATLDAAKAALDQAKATLEATRAGLIKAQADYDIGLAVQKQNKGAISEQELARRLGARDEAKASVESALAGVPKAQATIEQTRASLGQTQLNYDWCKVRSPIDGQVGRYLFTLGNLVNADLTVLTTVVTTHPMYVYFDIDENTMLDVLRKRVLPSKVDLLAEKDGVPVFCGLADEQGFPHKGYVNFGNNVVNPSTGTITMRGVFENPANPVGKALLRPGMFVRVHLPLDRPRRALLVSEKALGSDQGQKFLLVVDDKNVVAYRRVKTGPLQENGLRVIADGLKTGERVIISGLQMVRPQMTVQTEELPMPVQGQESGHKDQGMDKENGQH